MQSLQSASVSAKPAKKPKSVDTPDVGQDIAPDTHVEKLVNEERATSPRNDLLTDKRPVE